MWLVVGGRITDTLVSKLDSVVKSQKFQGVDSVLDVTNTIFKKGLDHFKDVEGVVVVSSGCHSIVDMGWMLQFNRLGVPVLYYSTYTINTGSEVDSLSNISVHQGGNISIKEIAKGVYNNSKKDEVVG